MNKRILIWTAQMAKHRRAKTLDVPFLDLTAMSGNKAFAPEMRNVLLYKNGQMNEEDYTRIYVEKMRRSVLQHMDEWNKIFQYDKLVVACYCRAGVFCHRHIWMDLMGKYARSRGNVVINMGEFLEDSDLAKTPVRIVHLPKTLSEAAQLARYESIETFLVTSYCYYILAESLIPDTVYDFIAGNLLHAWDKLSEEERRHLDKDALVAGTHFQVKKEDYPDWVREEAKKVCSN